MHDLETSAQALSLVQSRNLALKFSGFTDIQEEVDSDSAFTSFKNSQNTCPPSPPVTQAKAGVVLGSTGLQSSPESLAGLVRGIS